jgi:transcriptional regulator GlxA family with amidase domain
MHGESSEDAAMIGNELIREANRCAFGKPRDGDYRRLAPEAAVRSPLEKALTHIEARLFEPLSIKAVAKLAGLSESSLLRLFKSQLDASPYAYIRRRRLEEAKGLLGCTEFSIRDVATLVGFTNASAFTEAFRSLFSVSPREFRGALSPKSRRKAT